uniref:Uncharacterized protein n=1 Tax=Oryza brachyantha TaxID=4533 RepID=J3N3I2_ORYBR
MYLVWSVLAGAAAPSPYDELYGDEDEESSDSESPKKVGYVIIPGVESHDGVNIDAKLVNDFPYHSCIRLVLNVAG